MNVGGGVGNDDCYSGWLPMTLGNYGDYDETMIMMRLLETNKCNRQSARGD